MIDFSAILFDPAYGILGTPAKLEPRAGPTRAVDITVIDQTSPSTFNLAGGSPVVLETIGPSVVVRLKELQGLLINYSELDGGKLTLRGKSWIVQTAQLVSTPDGSGEVRMNLVEAD